MTHEVEVEGFVAINPHLSTVHPLYPYLAHVGGSALGKWAVD